MSADSTAQKDGYYILACNDESVKNKSTARLVTWTFTKKQNMVCVDVHYTAYFDNIFS